MEACYAMCAHDFPCKNVCLFGSAIFKSIFLRTPNIKYTLLLGVGSIHFGIHTWGEKNHLRAMVFL